MKKNLLVLVLIIGVILTVAPFVDMIFNFRIFNKLGSFAFLVGAGSFLSGIFILLSSAYGLISVKKNT